jgi:MtN3 and saliva related transmembrane protein
MTFDLISVTGIAASVLTAASMLPQLLKIIKEKEARDISLWMLGILVAGLGLWVYYGVLRKDWIIIIANGFSGLVNITVAILSLVYKKKDT